MLQHVPRLKQVSLQQQLLATCCTARLLLGHGGRRITALYRHFSFNICFNMQFAQYIMRNLELGHAI